MSLRLSFLSWLSQHVPLTRLNRKNGDDWDESGRNREEVPKSLFQRRPPPASWDCALCPVTWSPAGSEDHRWPRGKPCAGDSVSLFSLLQWPAELEPVAKGHIGGVVGRRRKNKHFLCRQTYPQVSEEVGVARLEEGWASSWISTGYAGSVASSRSRDLWLSCGSVIAGGGQLTNMSVFIRCSLGMATFGHLNCSTE